MATSGLPPLVLEFDIDDKGQPKVRSIKGALDALRTPLDHVEQGAKKASSAFSLMGKSASSVTNFMFSMKGMLVTAATSFATTFAVNTIKDFEFALKNVLALTEATSDQMAKLSSVARQLGASTEFSATDAAKAMALFGQAGYKVNQILDVMPSALDLATASQESMAGTAENLTGILAGFGLVAADAAHSGDVLAFAAGATNTNVRDLALGMSFVAPAAKTAGQSLENVSAAMGVLSNAGISGMRAGTNLRGVMMALIDRTPEATAAIKSLGLTVQELDPRFNSLTQIFKRLKEVGFDTKAGLPAAAAIFGRELISSAQVLTSYSGQLDDLTKGAENADGAMKRMADTLRGGTKGGLDELSSSVEELVHSLGDAGLKKAIDAVIGVLIELVQDIAKVTKAFSTDGAMWETTMSNVAIEMVGLKNVGSGLASDFKVIGITIMGFFKQIAMGFVGFVKGTLDQMVYNAQVQINMLIGLLNKLPKVNIDPIAVGKNPDVFGDMGAASDKLSADTAKEIEAVKRQRVAEEANLRFQMDEIKLDLQRRLDAQAKPETELGSKPGVVPGKDGATPDAAGLDEFTKGSDKAKASVSNLNLELEKLKTNTKIQEDLIGLKVNAGTMKEVDAIKEKYQLERNLLEYTKSALETQLKATTDLSDQAQLKKDIYDTTAQLSSLEKMEHLETLKAQNEELKEQKQKQEQIAREMKERRQDELELIKKHQDALRDTVDIEAERMRVTAENKRYLFDSMRSTGGGALGGLTDDLSAMSSKKIDTEQRLSEIDMYLSKRHELGLEEKEIQSLELERDRIFSQNKIGLFSDTWGTLNNMFDSYIASTQGKSNTLATILKTIQALVMGIRLATAAASLFGGPGLVGAFGGASASAASTAGGAGTLVHSGRYIYHNGTSNVGLKPDEVNATLQKGEGVISRRGMQILDEINSGAIKNKGTSGGVVVANFIDPKVFDRYVNSYQGRNMIKNIIKEENNR